MRDVLVEYDKTVEGGRIGFAATDCDALLKDQLAQAGGVATRGRPRWSTRRPPAAAPAPRRRRRSQKRLLDRRKAAPAPNDAVARTNNAYDYDEAEAGGYVLVFILCVACAAACYARCYADPSRRRGVELPYLGEVRFFRWGDSGYVELDGEDEERAKPGSMLGGGMGRRGGTLGGGTCSSRPCRPASIDGRRSEGRSRAS